MASVGRRCAWPTLLHHPGIDPVDVAPDAAAPAKLDHQGQLAGFGDVDPHGPRPVTSTYFSIPAKVLRLAVYQHPDTGAAAAPRLIVQADECFKALIAAGEVVGDPAGAVHPQPLIVAAATEAQVAPVWTP